jgi:hypothetical protein
VVRSHDRKPFLIKRVECKVPGMKAQAVHNAAGPQQTVEVDGASVHQIEGGRGVIAVFTDHPAQERVDVPFVVLDQGDRDEEFSQ